MSNTKQEAFKEFQANCPTCQTEQVQETEFGGSPLQKQKTIIHFSKGETLEIEDSEEEEEDKGSTHITPFRGPSEKAQLSFKNLAIRVGRISLMVWDFLGERLASVLGRNTAKYQYAIDQYNCEYKGQPETTNFSPGQNGSQYGATGDMSSPSESQERHGEKHTVRKEGCHNRDYQTDDDSWKLN